MQTSIRRAMSQALALAAGVVALPLTVAPAPAHDLYTGVRGKDGQLCCGGNDCAVTEYRMRPGGADFFVKNEEWIFVPEARITFLPVPGDIEGRGHWCGRKADQWDKVSRPENIFGNWYMYCAFIPPGLT